jgi:hypothetical protein
MPTEAIEDDEPEAPVTGAHVEGLCDYASVWFDLLRIVQLLAERQKLSQVTDWSPDIFMRSALWDAAVAAYGRCFNTGTRRTKLTPFIARLPEALQRCHGQIIRARNTDIAHHDHSRDNELTAHAVFDADGAVVGIRLRVYPNMGPEVDPPFWQLVAELAALVERKMTRIEKRITRELDAADLAKVAKRHDPRSEGDDRGGRLRLTFDTWTFPSD